ncbi:MAG: methyltransferase domain-containing protein [Negativicutes bacterium]|nr:methyltransferase domain-containing protein [Negativicutes bacterium]
MFFADRIRSIRPSDRVLEVGPGACPHPRSDMLLEKRFASEAEAFGQRGRTPATAVAKPVVYFDGGKFPFGDNEFDYVICSHVLEHVEDIEVFCGELTRVARRGYLEYPTVYYEYLYDIPEHVMLLFWHDGTLRYLPKAESGIKTFSCITGFFFHTLQSGHDALIRSFMPAFFQGFEWSDGLALNRAKSVAELAWPLTAAGNPVSTEAGAEITVLVFSKDRAMQLDALLSSLLLHCREPQCLRVQVLFACSADRHRAQYRELASQYPQVSFLAETDFQAQVQEVLHQTEKILFLVDDSIFVRPFSARQLRELLDNQTQAAGVSLRLGRNTTYCYPLERFQPLPRFEDLGDGFLRYAWQQAEGDFGYPMEVSSSCYRAEDVLRVLGGSGFSNPNELEGAMAARVRLYLAHKQFLLCPEQSVAFSCPVNAVQTCCSNRHEPRQDFTAEFLADLFAHGRRVATEAYRDLVPNACHQPVELVFK